MINSNKLKRQNEGRDIWYKTKRGTLHYTMQFGKTYTAILIIKKLLENKDIINQDNILVITPSDIIRKQWESVLNTHHLKIKVLTAQQAINESKLGNYNSNIDLVIFDEIHKFISEERIKLITDILNYKYILGLTGTYPSLDNSKVLDKYCPVVDTITEYEALQNKWISPFIEYNLSVEFTEDDKLRYISYTAPIREILQVFKDSHKLFQVFKNDYEVLTACYAGKKGNNGFVKPKDVCRELSTRKGWNKELDLDYGNNSVIEEHWNPETIYQRAMDFNTLVRNRNDLIINNNTKLDIILEIYKKFKDKTIISFNESTDFATTITQYINSIGGKAIVYHSNIKSQPLIDPSTGKFITTKAGKVKIFGQTSLKNNAIEGIKNGDFTFLATARALDEGMSIPNIEVVICSGGTVNPMQYAQRSARGKTVDIYNPNKLTRIINLYFDDFYYEDKKIDCRDKQKLIKRQQENQSIIKWIKNIDEIL